MKTCIPGLKVQWSVEREFQSFTNFMQHMISSSNKFPNLCLECSFSTHIIQTRGKWQN